MKRVMMVNSISWIQCDQYDLIYSFYCVDNLVLWASCNRIPFANCQSVSMYHKVYAGQGYLHSNPVRDFLEHESWYDFEIYPLNVFL